MARTCEDEFPNGSNGKRVRPKVDAPKYLVLVVRQFDGGGTGTTTLHFNDAGRMNEYLGKLCLSSNMSVVIYTVSEIYAYEGAVLRAELI